MKWDNKVKKECALEAFCTWEFQREFAVWYILLLFWFQSSPKFSEPNMGILPRRNSRYNGEWNTFSGIIASWKRDCFYRHWYAFGSSRTGRTRILTFISVRKSYSIYEATALENFIRLQHTIPPLLWRNKESILGGRDCYPIAQWFCIPVYQVLDGYLEKITRGTPKVDCTESGTFDKGNSGEALSPDEDQKLGSRTLIDTKSNTRHKLLLGTYIP